MITVSRANGTSAAGVVYTGYLDYTYTYTVDEDNHYDANIRDLTPTLTVAENTAL